MIQPRDPLAFYLDRAIARAPRLAEHAVELELAAWDYCVEHDIEPRLGPTLERIVHEICAAQLDRELAEMGRRGA